MALKRSLAAGIATRAAAAAASVGGDGSSHSALPLDTDGWDYLACSEEVHPIGTNNVVSGSRGGGGEGRGGNLLLGSEGEREPCS